MKRIQILIEDAMCSEAMYAKKAGIDPGNFHKKLVGIQKWTINDIKKICTKFNVSKEWIVDGKGDMMTKDDYQPQMKTLPSDLAQTISIGTEKTKLRIPTKALAGYLSDYVDGVRVEDCEPQPVIHLNLKEATRLPANVFMISSNGERHTCWTRLTVQW